MAKKAADSTNYVCSICGSVVGDEELHTSFHDLLQNEMDRYEEE
jgi:hypothetical protein